MTRPPLVVVSGPAGHGKTTLARRLADSLGLPAVCRDEIKEGMIRTAGVDSHPDRLNTRTLAVFFDLVTLLLDAGVGVVADAAFQDHVWRPNLEPLTQRAAISIVQCHTDPATARRRIEARGIRAAHADKELLARLDAGEPYFAAFQRIAIDAPTIAVDTTDGYSPPLEDVVAFVNAQSS